MLISYVARRSLIGGHVAGLSYDFEIDTLSLVRSRSVRKVAQRSLSGQLETLYFGGDNEWSVQFAPVSGATLAALVEFLDSTEDGDSFAMQLYGSTQPLRAVKRIDEGYELQEFVAVGLPGADWFTASVRVLEVYEPLMLEAGGGA